MIPIDLFVLCAMEAAHGVLAAVARPVEPTVVSFRPLPTPMRHPPWDPESVIVDDLGVAPRRRERRDR